MREIYIRRMKFDEAKEKLDREVQKAFVEGETLIEVVHGIGEGRLKQLTLDYVKENDFLRLFSTTGLTWENPGSTKIEILGLSKNEIKRYMR